MVIFTVFSQLRGRLACLSLQSSKTGLGHFSQTWHGHCKGRDFLPANLLPRHGAFPGWPKGNTLSGGGGLSTGLQKGKSSPCRQPGSTSSCKSEAGQCWGDICGTRKFTGSQRLHAEPRGGGGKEDLWEFPRCCLADDKIHPSDPEPQGCILGCHTKHTPLPLGRGQTPGPCACSWQDVSRYRFKLASATCGLKINHKADVGGFWETWKSPWDLVLWRPMRCPANTGGPSAWMPGVSALHIPSQCLWQAHQIGFTFSSVFFGLEYWSFYDSFCLSTQKKWVKY